MEAPARALISAAEPQHWHNSVIGSHHVSHVMRLGRMAGKEAVLRFLDRVATPSWLEQVYEEAPSSGLAASLFGLWGYYEQSILDHFRVTALTSRVSVEMGYLNILTPVDLSAALQLLGCSALMGVEVNSTLVRWPHASRVRDAIHFTAPKTGGLTIGHVQIRLWLGLREMARLRADPVPVEAQSGDRILNLWKNSTGYTDKQNKLKRVDDSLVGAMRPIPVEFGCRRHVLYRVGCARKMTLVRLEAGRRPGQAGLRGAPL